MIKSVAELKSRIVFMHKTCMNDDIGNQIAAWETFAECWAAVKDLSGREYFAAAAVQMENTTSFTVRRIEGLDSSMRILHGGEEYEIQHIGRLGHRGKYLEITASIKRPEGGRAVESQP